MRPGQVGNKIINPKKQQRNEDSQNIAEEIIKQSELAQGAWDVFTKEEEQNQTQPEDRLEEADEDDVFSDQVQQVFKHGAVI